jgi:hypothetical protein
MHAGTLLGLYFILYHLQNGISKDMKWMTSIQKSLYGARYKNQLESNTYANDKVSFLHDVYGFVPSQKVKATCRSVNPVCLNPVFYKHVRSIAITLLRSKQHAVSEYSRHRVV